MQESGKAAHGQESFRERDGDEKLCKMAWQKRDADYGFPARRRTASSAFGRSRKI